MSEELKTEVNEQVNVEQPAEVQQDTTPETSVSESAPDSVETHEKSNGFQKRMDKVTRQRYEEKARADEAEKRLKELEEKLNQSVAAEPEVSSAPIAMPDDDLKYTDKEEYDRQMQAFRESITNQAVRELKQQAEQQRQQEKEQKKQEKEREKYAKDMAAFELSAAEANIDAADAFKSLENLTQRGVPYELDYALLHHPQKAALIVHLDQNPSLYEQVASASINAYAAKDGLDAIVSDALSQKISSAPEPVPSISGMGVVEKDSFEEQFGKASFD